MSTERIKILGLKYELLQHNRLKKVQRTIGEKIMIKNKISEYNYQAEVL